MKTKLKVSIFITATLVIVLLISSQIVVGGDKKSCSNLKSKGFRTENIFIPYKEGKVRVFNTGTFHKNVLLFIHGSPGDWSAWQNVIEDSVLQANFNIYCVDRPGFGKSTSKALSTLKEQSEAIKCVIDSLNLQQITLISHSYGGGVAEQLLIDYPNLWVYNIFVAPTLSPKLQKPKWYNKAGKFLNFMLPRVLKSSNKEMLGLHKSLLLIENEIFKIKTPITYIQGEKDWLVPAKTIDYFKTHFKRDAKYILDAEESHFILWTKPELIKSEILKKLE